MSDTGTAASTFASERLISLLPSVPGTNASEPGEPRSTAAPARNCRCADAAPGARAGRDDLARRASRAASRRRPAFERTGVSICARPLGKSLQILLLKTRYVLFTAVSQRRRLEPNR